MGKGALPLRTRSHGTRCFPESPQIPIPTLRLKPPNCDNAWEFCTLWVASSRNLESSRRLGRCWCKQWTRPISVSRTLTFGMLSVASAKSWPARFSPCRLRASHIPERPAPISQAPLTTWQRFNDPPQGAATTSQMKPLVRAFCFDVDIRHQCEYH